MALVKNDICKVKIEGYSSEGQGIARVDGYVIFVKGAISGEVCNIKILKAGKTCAYAKIEEILEPSPHRIEPACASFGKCGGCSFMHMDYSEELNMKLHRVNDALRRIGGVDIEADEILGMESVCRYRNKTIFAVSRSEGRAVTGFFRGRSHDVIPVSDCIIQSEYSARASEAVCRWMDMAGASAYDEKTGAGMIRHVFCRYAFVTGRGQTVVVSAKEKIPKKDKLIEEILKACPETDSIVLNVNDTVGNTVLKGRFLTLWGNDKIEDELCGLRFCLSPQSFYQVNRRQAERLYEKAAEFADLDKTETVLDLYCGTGTITLFMAKKARLAIGAEIVAEAIDDAKKNAENNGIKNAEFICADAGMAAKKLLQQGKKPDVIIVDPPRKGLGDEVPEIMASMEPKRIVYVSCDPATLARDVKKFSELGYKAQKASAVDMFPRCAHVETVVLLSRAEK